MTEEARQLLPEETFSESPCPSTLSVGVLEGHRLLREAISGLLPNQGVEVPICESDPASFLRAIRERPVVAALVDLGVAVRRSEGLLVLDGLSLVIHLRRTQPALRILALSSDPSPEGIDRCFREGVCGVLIKPTLAWSELVEAIQKVCRGERVFPPISAASGARSHTALSHPPLSVSSITPRQRELLGHLVSGADNLKIATWMKISERTVKAHLTGLYRACGCSNRTQLALLARQLGVTVPPSP